MAPRSVVFLTVLFALSSLRMAMGAQRPSSYTCRQGYVRREAFPHDLVCVTPETRAQAAADNHEADARRQPGGGVSGPNTCRLRYVWREAGPNDLVCMSEQESGCVGPACTVSW